MAESPHRLMGLLRSSSSIYFFHSLVQTAMTSSSLLRIVSETMSPPDACCRDLSMLTVRSSAPQIYGMPRPVSVPVSLANSHPFPPLLRIQYLFGNYSIKSVHYGSFSFRNYSRTPLFYHQIVLKVTPSFFQLQVMPDLDKQRLSITENPCFS